ncbi:hypothetical protein HNY73_016146 [Argiope bruennichi]|uniref:DUF19 domain-containing protein n=1 Tax=Argiope bruennichi TaxID=94029 RepID=A0A8T0EHV8_ARGBR|nr:hypothetical protein HNY73_016146 [Argiope bruennichi]
MTRFSYLLFFLLAIQGSTVLGFLENCENQGKCQDLELKKELESIDWVPTTEEHLNNLCPRVMKTLQCLAESIQECTGKDIIELSTSDNKTASAIGHLLVAGGNFVIDACTPGTEFRDNYLSSISCFKDLVMDPEPTMKCHREGYAVYATYEQSRELLGNEIPDEDKESESWCMVTAYTLACFTSELHDTCGEVARKTFVETMKRFQSLRWNECTEANIRNLKTEFLDFLELEEQKRDIFFSVFESKKRRK